MDVTFTAWAALIAGLVVLLLFDLFVLHRGTHEVSIRNAAWSTAGFVAVSFAFGTVLGLAEGSTVAGEFFAGYLLEYSLSLDNVFVWSLILTSFAIPPAYQHRVLFYGIFGALILRGAFVAAGAELLARFEWVVYIFGALLIYAGVRMLRGRQRQIDTALALVGLRSMYFLLAGARLRFRYLDVGLAVILVFIGTKFLLTEVVHIGVGVNLLVIVGVMTVAIVASLLASRRERRRVPVGP